MLKKILFCDCRSERSDEIVIQIIRNITGNSELIFQANVDYKWNIVTKYYKTLVSIEIKNYQDIHDNNCVRKYPAVVLLTDGKDMNNVDKLWNLLDINSEIRLLVTCDSELGNHVHDWCLENNFELIELLEKASDSDIEDINNEVTGWRRIKSALEANDWCNLISDSASDEELQVDQFEQLLGQLGDMKNRVETANLEDRRRIAEEVTVQFWRAMGGSESELNDL